jgi:hypothetical protein
VKERAAEAGGSFYENELTLTADWRVRLEFNDDIRTALGGSQSFQRGAAGHAGFVRAADARRHDGAIVS